MSPKLTSNLKNMILSLGVISLVAGSLLAATYVVTKPTIEISRQAKKIAALKAVLPAFDNDPLTEGREDKTLGTVIYTASLEGVLVGRAVMATTPKGFSGDVTLMTGFTTEQKIFKVAVLSQKETPGLGTKMTNPLWLGQFEGKAPLEAPLAVSKDGGQIDALTAATISSRAAVDAVNRAAEALKKGVSP